MNIFATSKKGGFDNEKLKKYILNDVWFDINYNNTNLLILIKMFVNLNCLFIEENKLDI